MVDFRKRSNESEEEGQEQKKDSKKAKRGHKKLDLAVLAMIDNIVFNKTDQWAYYRISNSVFDFVSNDTKVAGAMQIINAFTNLMSDRQDPLECHIIVSSTPINIQDWENEVREISKTWNVAPGFEEFMRKQAEHLEEEEFVKKVTYLGINISKRGSVNLNSESFFEAGFKQAGEQLKNWLNSAVKVSGEEISPQEERDAKRTEEEFFRTLSTGNLQAERCSAEELLLLIKRQFYPTMPAPYLNIDHGSRMGAGDLDLELGSAIFNRLRWLEINQFIDEVGTDLTGYRAALTMSSFPKQVVFPYDSLPFMYFLHKLAMPFDCYARFKLHPVVKMKKKLEGKKKVALDELENYAKGGGTVDSALGTVPPDIVEALEDMDILTSMLAANNTPWVEGTYRIVIETPTEEILKKYVTAMKQRFADIGILLQWSIGDQAQLFLEQMPGDKIRDTAHQHITDLNFLGISGFSYSSDVGDSVSMRDKMIKGPSY